MRKNNMPSNPMFRDSIWTQDFFTINDEDGKPSHRITFFYDDSPLHRKTAIPFMPFTMKLQQRQGGNWVDLGEFTIQPQQATELGALILALAGVVGIDFSGADAVLDGFCLKGKAAAQTLADALGE